MKALPVNPVQAWALAVAPGSLLSGPIAGSLHVAGTAGTNVFPVSPVQAILDVAFPPFVHMAGTEGKYVLPVRPRQVFSPFVAPLIWLSVPLASLHDAGVVPTAGVNVLPLSSPSQVVFEAAFPLLEQNAATAAV